MIHCMPTLRQIRDNTHGGKEYLWTKMERVEVRSS